MSSTIVREATQAHSNRLQLMAAFALVVACSGRRTATDLHVRKLLRYVCAKDRDGNGVARSLEQLSDRLLLSVSTTRRIIRRAVKHFGLLTVTHQRHFPGGQTLNRYSINWPAVTEKCEPPIKASSTENSNTLFNRQSGSDRELSGSSFTSCSSASPAVKKSAAAPKPALSNHAPDSSHSPWSKDQSLHNPPALSDHALLSTAQTSMEFSPTNCTSGSDCGSHQAPDTSDHAPKSSGSPTPIAEHLTKDPSSPRRPDAPALSDHASAHSDHAPHSSTFDSLPATLPAFRRRLLSPIMRFFLQPIV